MTKTESCALLIAFFAVASVGCGRNELDDGFPTTDVQTGSGGDANGTGGTHAGSGGAHGSGGAVGSGGSTGSGGAGGSGSGSGGRNGSGGAVGSGGSGGRTGSGGGIGGSGGTTGSGVACGAMTCQAGTQSCCIQAVGGRRTETCISAKQTCDGGPSIGCVGGDCGAGTVCCFSLVNVATMCTAPSQCANGLATVLCGADNDCPANRSHCCSANGISICRATSCGGGPPMGGPAPGPAPRPRNEIQFTLTSWAPSRPHSVASAS